MRTRLLAPTFLLTLAGGAAVALSVPAHSDEQSDTPLHSRLHLTGVVLDETEWPVSIDKCKPLANGRAVPLNAHHANLHTGGAGEAQWQAGNAVVPVFLDDEDTGVDEGTPWTDCASLMAFFGLD